MKKIYKILSFLVMASMVVGLIPIKSLAVDIPTVITKNGNVIFANGIPIVIKEVTEGSTKNTYVYDSTGTTRLDIYDNAGTKQSPIITGFSIYGGTELSGDVASTNIVFESGKLTSIIGGGKAGNVLGNTYVTVKEGTTVSTIYGGGATGKVVGSTNVESYKTTNSQSRIGGGGVTSGTVEGDVNIILHEPNNPTALYGGSGSVGDVNGNVNITVNGGRVANVFGGCATTGVIKGWANITITGNAVVGETAFQATGKNYVVGGAKVYIPEGFSETALKNIITADKNQKQGGKVNIYQNGSKIYPTVSVTHDEANKNVYANGLSVSIKTYAEDGKTYVFDASGAEKLLSIPVDGYKIFGGSEIDDASQEAITKTNITMESGRVAAIYGGGSSGNVKGTSSVIINGGVVDSVYAGGITGAVDGISSVFISEIASVTGSVYALNSNATVIRLPVGFDTSKLLRGNNSRIFIGSAELPDRSIIIPKEVTKGYVDGENCIFANGIPIVVKKDASDGRTYVYDVTGTIKLLSTEINGYAIFGGSEKGVVESTNVTMESGTVSRIYGGGYYSCVSGPTKVTVNGGDIAVIIYGGSYNGDVGSSYIYVGGPYVTKNVSGGSKNGCVLGDVEIILIDSVAKGIYGGTGVTDSTERLGCPSSDVLGNVSITMDGGSADAIYGGSKGKSDVIRGTSTMTFKGHTMIKGDGILPQSNGGVLGGAHVYIPTNFMYKNKITNGEGITVHETGYEEPEATPEKAIQTEKVLSTKGDEGKLVYRFINIPEPNGNLTGRPGEAIYVTFPNGQNMLIDGGGDTEYCRDILFKFLDDMGITKIDYVVATHYHADHVGSMADIFNRPNMDIGKLFTTGFKIPTGTYYNKNLGDWVNANPSKVEHVWRGQTFNIGDVTIEFLNPVNDAGIIKTMNGTPTTDDVNNNSIVFKITYGEHTSLMTGDIYAAIEKQLVLLYKNDPDILKADLIKPPHHGDTSSSDPLFVEAVSPDVAVLTHFFNTLSTNNRYKGVGADTYCTGEDGIVKLVYDGVNEAPQVTTEFYIAKPTTMEVTGGTDIISVDSNKETVTEFTYKVCDQYGKEMNNVKIVRILTDDNGNLVNDPAITFENDNLTVKGKPQVSYVVVTFIYGDIKVSKRIEFKALSQGGGGSGSYPGTPVDEKPVVIAKPDGTTSVTVTVTKNNLENSLKDATKTTLVVNVEDKATESIVKLTADSFSALAKREVNLEVKTDTAEFNIPSAIIDVAAIEKKLGTTAENINIEVKIVEVPQSKIVLPEGTSLKPTDKVYSFSIIASNGNNSVNIDSFDNNKVKVTMSMPTALEGKDEARINMYKYNEVTKALELCSTKVDDGKIVSTMNSSSLYAVMYNAITFNDMNTHWAQKYVHTLAAKDIILGKGGNTYDPEGNMTRAEFASIIARAFSLPEGTGTTFTDVDASAWYAKEINAAYSAGIISGNGDGTFAPEALITREEMAVIASRVYKLLKSTGTSGSLVAFTDANEISDWAADEVAEAYKLGVVKGYNGMFVPKAEMTRAEGATVIYNLIYKLGLEY